MDLGKRRIRPACSRFRNVLLVGPMGVAEFLVFFLVFIGPRPEIFPVRRVGIAIRNSEGEHILNCDICA
jgi:hypothetical protein